MRMTSLILMLLVPALLLAACGKEECVKNNGELGILGPENEKQCCSGLAPYTPKGSEISYCMPKTSTPRKPISVIRQVQGVPADELELDDGVVTAYGKAINVGSYDCRCFDLESREEKILVSYENTTLKDIKEGDLLTVQGTMQELMADNMARKGLEASMIWRVILEEDIIRSFEEQAKSVIINSPTYSYDGSGLEVIEVKALDCQRCYEITIKYQSEHAGYGDRTGQNLTKQRTEHTAVLRYQSGLLKRAMLDNEYNILTQRS